MSGFQYWFFSLSSPLEQNLKTEDPASGDVRKFVSKEIKFLRVVAIATVCQQGLIKVVYYLMLL